MNILESIQQKARSISQARQAEIAVQSPMSSQNTNLLTLIFIAGYAALFHIGTRYSHNLAHCLISSVHAIAIVTFSFLYLLGKVKLSTYRYLLCISIAYFVFSFGCVLGLMYAQGAREMLPIAIYHVAVFLCISMYRKKYPDLIARGMLSDIATLFSCACSFLMEINQVNTMLYKFMFAMTLITWGITRVVNFTMIYRSLYKRKASLGAYLVFMPVMLMGYYAFGQLVMQAIG